MFLGNIFPPKSIIPFGEALLKRQKITLSGINNKTAKSFLFAALFAQKKFFKTPGRFVWILNNKNDVLELSETIQLFLPLEEYEIKTLSLNNKEIQKTEWIIGLQKPPLINELFILSQKDVAESFPDFSLMEKDKITLFKDQKINLLELFNSLIEAGFEISQDVVLEKGQHRRSGDIIDIFPFGYPRPIKIELEFDRIKNIYEFFPDRKKIGQSFEEIEIFPQDAPPDQRYFFEFFQKDDVLIFDDLEDIDLFEDKIEKIPSFCINFSSFAEIDDYEDRHLRFLSVLKFFNLFDLITDLRTKLQDGWDIVILTKRTDELKNIFIEEKIPFYHEEEPQKGALLLDAKDLEHIPTSFQNQAEKILFLTDREIFQIRQSRKVRALENANLEFLTSLKIGDYVVHADHGIGRFFGICEQPIDNITREFLEIGYAGNDKLFVPIDQADKVARFVGDESVEPRITRLGSQEWRTICRNVKKEAEKVAKELLRTQALRDQAKGFAFKEDDEAQKRFEQTFPYEETPGQIRAIRDTKDDMESGKPMDRLICGDVGFGKTEVAMRAAFKAFCNGKQTALISPITILADQHYRSFKKRMESFDVNVEMLSRFRSPAEQKKIVHDLEKGKIHVIVGTHRLLQEDIKFFDLGLVVIDEEQRFGVKQKEKFKQLRKEVDILTLSATPIPRTLNLALHKLRDITTITTPPPGRLPVITEIRKYSDNLVKEAITKELARGGQVFFLHNRVETIESIAHKLRFLVPEARFIVAHGQLNPDELEKRILAFKNKEYDVLVSSTIIENGIDLPNANTLIVRNAEQFGLAQLYQLRGRIGRGRIQAHAYLLYQTQKLKPEAKKRLRAIVEASELGSGFQIAMKDLEIRGAGDILGVNQHGMVNTVGVHHFLRLLDQTINQMKAGETKEAAEEEKDVMIEIPIDAFVPSTFIPDQKEKILAYQQLAAVKTIEGLEEIAKDLEEEFGKPPREVRNLFKVLEIKLFAREARLLAVRSVPLGREGREIQLHLSKHVTAMEIMNLLQHNDKWLISGDKLKINVQELGFNWVDELTNCIKILRKISDVKKPRQSDQ